VGHNFNVPIWGVVNQKGGVGKTTTVVNLAAGLAQRGQKTLLVDCDPQGNATTGLGIDKANLKLTLYEVLAEAVQDADSAKLAESAVVHIADNLDVIPATLDLAGAEPLLMTAVGKELVLRDALACIRDRYDWILLDSPPSLGLLTINILSVCDSVLVPMQCEFFALEGLSQLLKAVGLVRKRINPNLVVAKVLLTMYDGRNRLTQQVTDELRNYFGEKVSRTVIPRNVRLSESPSFGEASIVRFPSSKGAQAYAELVSEVMAECAAH
jgi:chromosome partitioning protein